MCHPLILRLSKTIWFVFTKMYPGKKYGDLCRCSALRSLKKVQPIKINLQVVCSCPTEFCVILSRLRCARHPRLLKFLWRSLGLEGLGLTVTQCPTRHRTTQGLTLTFIDRPSGLFTTDVIILQGIQIHPPPFPLSSCHVLLKRRYLATIIVGKKWKTLDKDQRSLYFNNLQSISRSYHNDPN